MPGAIWTIVAILAGGIAVILTVFYVGMRSKTPWVLNGVRRFARAVGNPWQMRTAGRAGATVAIIRHRGRTTGRWYATPVAAVPTDDGFVIATVYGSNTDWLKNVLASGTAIVVHEGETYEVVDPVLVPIETVTRFFPDRELRTLRRFRVDRCVRLHTVQRQEAAAQIRLERRIRSTARP